jgi:hypothetical protein
VCGRKGAQWRSDTEEARILENLYLSKSTGNTEGTALASSERLATAFSFSDSIQLSASALRQLQLQLQLSASALRQLQFQFSASALRQLQL